MEYLLDTNICVYALNQSDLALIDRLRSVRRSNVYVASLTIGEMLFGAQRSSNSTENVKRIVRFVAPFRELHFEQRAAEAYGALRAELASTGNQFGVVDMLLAGTALAHGLTVVTNNVREFKRAAGLRVENWSSPPRH